MGVYINGWIEVKNGSDDWEGVVKINSTFLNGGKSGEMMRSLYNLAEAKPLPANYSDEVIASYGSNQYVGIPNIIFWEKMVLVDWESVTLDWQFLYDVFRQIADYHEDKNVRLVFWGD
ncbi:MAG: hypothetical protein AAF846_02320 [Chloroflexota bacterium]